MRDAEHYIKRQNCRLSRFMVETVNRHFSLVQPHFRADFGRTIESAKHDYGDVHPQSQIEAEGTTSAGHAVQTFFHSNGASLLAVDSRFHPFS